MHRTSRDGASSRPEFGDERGIIVFGVGSGRSGRGCLFWIAVSAVLSVALTILANLVLAF